MALNEYRKKRNFSSTSEPIGKSKGKKHIFVVQKHHATAMHYDFRLEASGVLKSWAVPKGPSMNPLERRLALHVEDHPIEYAKFEGRIDEGNYGAGTVIVWDRGTYESKGVSVEEGLENGKVEVLLSGKKLRGLFTLIKLRKQNFSKSEPWLLIKNRDEYASEEDITKKEKSVISGKKLAKK